MGIFNKNKITIKKEIEENNTKIYVDYHKLKNPNEYKFSLIKDLIGENHSIMVIDTQLTYTDKGINIENKVKVLIEFLNEHSISYQKITTKSDNNFTMLGIPMKLNKTSKVSNYIIGFVVSSDDIKKLESIIDNFNAIFYIVLEDSSIDELLNVFNTAKGDMEELSNRYPFNIYNDNFFYKSRICIAEEKTEDIEAVIQRHVEN